LGTTFAVFFSTAFAAALIAASDAVMASRETATGTLATLMAAPTAATATVVIALE
jgi:hypothetical protein